MIKAITPFDEMTIREMGATMSQPVFLKKVWLPAGNCVSALLAYREKPVLILNSGKELVDDISSILYEMAEEFVTNANGVEKFLLPSPVRVFLTPRLLIKRKYSKESDEDELDIYPHSSHGFYGRLVRGTTSGLYVVQDIENENRFWLTVIDLETDQVYSSHTIKQYEYDVIRLKTWYDNFYELLDVFSPENTEEISQEIFGVLDNSDMSWEEIHRLTGGVVSPAFARGKTARETLNRLVPISGYPTEAQDQILAFLAWVAKDMIPMKNIIEFVNRVHAFPVFRFLVFHHLRFIMDNYSPPSYIQLITDAAEGNLRVGRQLVEERLRWKTDFLLQRKIEELVPDLQSEVIDIIDSLLKSNEIVTVYHSSKDSGGSKESLKNRIVIYDMGLRLRAHIRPRAFGLREIVYIGSAHRWPTWHLAYSIRLGPQNIRSPYIQGMVMPSSAFMTIQRQLPDSAQLYEIEWSTLTMNHCLYSQAQRKWQLRSASLLNSFDKSVSFKKLMSEFGYWKNSASHIPDESEAKILDMANSLFYLRDLEYKVGREYWQTDELESRKTLTRFRDIGAIDVLYWYGFMTNLTRVFIEIKGPEDRVCSVTRSLLKNVPTSLARMAANGKTALVISRVPTEESKNFSEMMINAAENSSLMVKCRFPSAIRNYQTDLFRRLLNPDGTWNDDVSGFLSQVRSAQKSLPEEI